MEPAMKSMSMLKVATEAGDEMILGDNYGQHLKGKETKTLDILFTLFISGIYWDCGTNYAGFFQVLIPNYIATTCKNVFIYFQSKYVFLENAPHELLLMLQCPTLPFVYIPYLPALPLCPTLLQKVSMLWTQSHCHLSLLLLFHSLLWTIGHCIHLPATHSQ